MVSITFMVNFYYIYGWYYIYGFYYIYGWYTQLDPFDVERTGGIAHVQIHVECVIGLLGQKYTIFAVNSTIGLPHLF